MPGMKRGEKLANSIGPAPRSKILISLVGMILSVSLSLGLLAINASLTPERVNNRRPLAMESPSDIVYFTRRKNTPSAGTSLTPVISVMHLILQIPRSNWMDVYLNVMLLPSSYARPRIKFRNR